LSNVDLNARLSANFTLGELAGTNDPTWRAAQLAGLALVPSSGPRTDTVAMRLGALARTILQPIRDHIGRPIKINSGYRCSAKNASIAGSSATSQHMLGEAADIAVPGYTDAQLYALAQWIGKSGLLFGQVIFEDKRPGTEGGAWIHVSLGAPYRAAARSGQRLLWTPTGGYQTDRS